MSFSAEVKNELSRVNTEKKCCQLAEIAGFIRASGSLKLAGAGKMHIVITTDNPAVARHYKKMIKEYFKVNASLDVIESNVFRKGHHYKLSIPPEERSEQILREVGLLLVREGNNYIADGIYDDIIRTKCCRKSYVRGVFLGAGSVSDPSKSYHLEIVCSSEPLARDLCKLINTFEDMEPKIISRNGRYAVYFKRAMNVRDLLAIMGAHRHVLLFDNVMLDKQMKNQATRITNCDDANLNRAVDAARKHIEAINKLKNSGRFSSLPFKLREVAEVRLENPELTISQLGELLEPPLKKSGVNNRLKKIMEACKEL